MATLSNNTSNDKSMNGLVTIDANSISTDELDVDTLVVNLEATATTVSALSNDTHVATTAWVNSHTSGNYVTLAGASQTISSQKTFNNFNYFINDGVLGPSSGTLLFEDSLGNGALMYYNNDNTGGLGGLRVVSTSYGFAFSSTFGAGEKCSFKSENISFEAVGGTITFLGAVPSCSIAPTTGNDLCNKTYVDSVSGSPLANNNVWTGTNAFNTSLPTSTVTPTTSTQLTTKTYVDSNFCDLSSNQTILGDKTFGIVGFGPPFDYTYFETITVFNVDVQLNQVDTTTMTSTQLGYTLQNTSRSTDNANTQVSNGTTKAILTFTPAKGVWQVNFSWKLTANTSGGSGTIGGYEICVSTTSASLTEYRNFYVLRELDDALGGAGGVRDRNSMSGVINTAGSTAFYINANIRFSGLASPNTVYLAIPMLTYTRIG